MKISIKRICLLLILTGACFAVTAGFAIECFAVYPHTYKLWTMQVKEDCAWETIAHEKKHYQKIDQVTFLIIGVGQLILGISGLIFLLKTHRILRGMRLQPPRFHMTCLVLYVIGFCMYAAFSLMWSLDLESISNRLSLTFVERSYIWIFSIGISNAFLLLVPLVMFAYFYSIKRQGTKISRWVFITLCCYSGLFLVDWFINIHSGFISYSLMRIGDWDVNAILRQLFILLKLYKYIGLPIKSILSLGLLFMPYMLYRQLEKAAAKPVEEAVA